MWKTAHIGDDRALQQQEKGVLQLDVLMASGIDAMVPGEHDLALGRDWLKGQAERVQAPYVATNLWCGGEPLFPRSRTVDIAGKRVLITGLLSPEAELPADCRADAPVALLQREIKEHPDHDLVVVLSRLSMDGDAELASEVPEVDLIVGGGSVTARPSPAQLRNGAVRLEAGSRGKLLVVADIEMVSGGRGFAAANANDDLQSTLDRTRSRRDKAIAQEAEATSDARRESATRRRTHLDGEVLRLEQELAAVQAAAQQPSHSLHLRQVSLDDAIADDPPTLVKVEATKAAIEERETAARVASATPLRGPYVGSNSCAGCHAEATAQWKTTAHAHAWQTLVDQRRQVDMECFSCHVTGAFHAEGPQHPNQVGSLQDVGCEACHGPGHDHVRDPATAHMTVDPPVSTCMQCHDGDRDGGRFDYNAYRVKVVHTAAP